MSKMPATEFAPAERSAESEISRQKELFSNLAHFKDFVNLAPDLVLVLNSNRQIVFANDNALSVFARVGINYPYGYRPGEALCCENASKNPCGCGTSVFCRYCGVVRAILSSLRGEEAVEECRITQEKTGDSFVFLAYGYPYELSGETFSIFILKDVTNERRTHILERVFLHDMMNLLTGVRGWINLLNNVKTVDEIPEIASTLTELSEELIDEFTAQKQLIAAEKYELTVDISRLNSLELLKSIKSFYENHSVYQGREIIIAPGARRVTFSSDESLLKRVLGNMVKNALEAINPGEAVNLGCAIARKEVQFWVRNPGLIPLEVQYQIFHLSFSTKGRDRGLGTYGMKLLSERYLKGKVWFTSSAGEGTRFVASYPLTLDPRK